MSVFVSLIKSNRKWENVGVDVSKTMKTATSLQKDRFEPQQLRLPVFTQQNGKKQHSSLTSLPAASQDYYGMIQEQKEKLKPQISEEEYSVRLHDFNIK